MTDKTAVVKLLLDSSDFHACLQVNYLSPNMRGKLLDILSSSDADKLFQFEISDSSTVGELRMTLTPTDFLLGYVTALRVIDELVGSSEPTSAS